ncbi:hypothetical protein [Duganella violaceipulchra]|uniref:Uncharacterized protein n=1 Tax=Duganella violaceipulchra TaxID=2849652 RepID=A0AA41L6J1_9BURK|nr:hypothetical protein [Duganella violaceicalia]MBV6320260.1 hypothetical protein [Duganella violaceicalia]MCP2011709.1 hypothetical protein [Duganella violaceicalia]
MINAAGSVPAPLREMRVRENSVAELTADRRVAERRDRWRVKKRCTGDMNAPQKRRRAMRVIRSRDASRTRARCANSAAIRSAAHQQRRTPQYCACHSPHSVS